MQKSLTQCVDSIIHSRMRLGIMACLMRHNEMTFIDLTNSLDATNGNISTHLLKLEAARYIKISKSFAGKVPCTKIRITQSGKAAWGKYTASLLKVFKYADH